MNGIYYLPMYWSADGSSLGIYIALSIPADGNDAVLYEMVQAEYRYWLYGVARCMVRSISYR